MRSAGLILVTAAVMVGGASWAGQPSPKLDFAIEDQFGELHTDEDCGPAVVILLGSGRKGVPFISEWGPPLHEALAAELTAGEVCLVGFAHVRGVPFFVKKKVVDSFSKDPEEWTLLDWKGKIAKSWGQEKDAANLYLFDRDGRLILHRGLRDFDETQLDGMVAATRSAVGEK